MILPTSLNLCNINRHNSGKERPTVLFFWSHGTPRSGDSYDLQVNEA